MADENKDQQQQDEILSLSKTEFQARLDGKYGEGAKKATKDILKDLGVVTLDDAKNAISKLKEAEERATKAENELNQAKHERMAIKLGATAEQAEDVVALLKGKGLEINEENLKKHIAKFKTGSAPNSVLGGSGTQQDGNKPKVGRAF